MSLTRLCCQYPIPWLLENTGIFFLAFLVNQYLDVTHRDGWFVWHWLRLFAQGLITVDGVIFLQKFYAEVLYADIPWFSAEKRKSYVYSSSALAEWFVVHIPGRLVATGLFTWHIFNVEETVYQQVVNRPFHPFLLLPKLLFIRIVADLVFYFIHYALHNRRLFALIHKTHHEHVYTKLETNYHFSVADLLLEGFFPFFVALQLFTLITNYVDIPSLYLSRFDLQLAVIYTQWLEIGSHNGKPVPTVTAFPPLSILYQLFWPEYDVRNALFHESHHNLVTCNYGINPWTDRLFGTEKYNLAAVSNQA